MMASVADVSASISSDSAPKSLPAHVITTTAPPTRPAPRARTDRHTPPCRCPPQARSTHPSPAPPPAEPPAYAPRPPDRHARPRRTRAPARLGQGFLPCNKPLTKRTTGPYLAFHLK